YWPPPSRDRFPSPESPPGRSPARPRESPPRSPGPPAFPPGVRSPTAGRSPRPRPVGTAAPARASASPAPARSPEPDPPASRHRPAPVAGRRPAAVETEIDAVALDVAADVGGDRVTIAINIEARLHRDHGRIHRDDPGPGAQADRGPPAGRRPAAPRARIIRR